jgi:hypothetical protein
VDAGLGYIHDLHGLAREALVFFVGDTRGDVEDVLAAGGEESLEGEVREREGGKRSEEKQRRVGKEGKEGKEGNEGKEGKEGKEGMRDEKEEQRRKSYLVVMCSVLGTQKKSESGNEVVKLRVRSGLYRGQRRAGKWRRPAGDQVIWYLKEIQNTEGLERERRDTREGKEIRGKEGSTLAFLVMGPSFVSL